MEFIKSMSWPLQLRQNVTVVADTHAFKQEVGLLSLDFFISLSSTSAKVR